MKNYGIYIQGEAYYGLDASWEKYTNDYYGKDGPSKEQIIKCINDNIDYLSKFISPSILLDFLRALGDALTGDELYSNLCDNLFYIETLRQKASRISMEFAIEFMADVFGETIPYDQEDRCHIMLFPEEKQNNLSVLFYKLDRFKEWFSRHLAKDKTVFQIIIGEANPEEIIKADVIEQLNAHLKNVAFHEKEIERLKEYMEFQLGRLSPSVALSEDEKKVIEEAKAKVTQRRSK